MERNVNRNRNRSARRRRRFFWSLFGLFFDIWVLAACDKSDQITLEDVNRNVNETLTERNVSVNVNLILI